MKDLQDMLHEIQQLEKTGAPFVMATVVRTAGSAYRAPGTRMLIRADQHRIGTISGGCLERDVVDNSADVFDHGIARILTYDATSEEDLLWGTGMGCSGVVQVMLERMPPAGFNYGRFLMECVFGRHLGVLATVFEVDDIPNVEVGQRLSLNEIGSVEGEVANEVLKGQILQDSEAEMRTLVQTRTPIALGKPRQYEVEGGRAGVLIEPVVPPVQLVIFGAGDDAVPVVRLAGELGWQVFVADHRPAFAVPDRLPEAHEVLLARPPEVFDQLPLGNSCALVMTHNYMQDRDILRHLLGVSVRYLGVLGPRARTDRLLDDIEKEGMTLTDEQQNRVVFGPVGLDLGAETAEEIALSIVGEIRGVLSNRAGGHLRGRGGPIHNRPV